MKYSIGSDLLLLLVLYRALQTLARMITLNKCKGNQHIDIGKDSHNSFTRC